MRLPPLVFICLLAFICQITFSIYYSLAIVDQNTLINNQQNEVSNLSIVHQELSNSLARLNSLNNIIEASGSSGLAPINQSIDLR